MDATTTAHFAQFVGRARGSRAVHIHGPRRWRGTPAHCAVTSGMRGRFGARGGRLVHAGQTAHGLRRKVENQNPRTRSDATGADSLSVGERPCKVTSPANAWACGGTRIFLAAHETTRKHARTFVRGSV